MIESRSKRAILAALSYAPDFSALAHLPALNSKAGSNCLRWLDQSGLALLFFRSLRDHGATDWISAAWRQAFYERQQRNVIRLHDMVEEAKRINSTFLSYGVTAALLKGFTLAPDFCSDPSLRHQVDFDFLVAPGDTGGAAEALSACGYSAAYTNGAGESCFLTPSRHIPSAKDDLYCLQRQRQVDLHTSLWERCPWLSVETPSDCFEHSEIHEIFGFPYRSLSREDKFLLQVLHVFRHAVRPWIRVSWLLEIGTCLENHQKNAGLWNCLIARAGNADLTKSIFAFVLGLVRCLFHTPIPAPLRSWTSEAATPRLRTWLDHFGFEWAISDWPGSLNNIFLAAEFIPDEGLRRQYWRNRLIPKRVSMSLGSVVANSPQKTFQLQVARGRYVAKRALVHLKDLAALPRRRFSWKRALQRYGEITFG